MLKLSCTTELAWQAAADEAVYEGSKEIEPNHLLIGVCSVDKFLAMQDGEKALVPESQREEIRLEAAPWEEAMSEAALDARSLRRALRRASSRREVSHLPADTARVRRSAASQEIFARAEVLAVESGSVYLGLIHLATALLETSEEKIESAFYELGNRKSVLREALLRTSMPRRRSGLPITGATLELSPLQVTESMDASLSPYPLGKRLALDDGRAALLYELPLLFGSGRPVTEVLQQTLQKIQSVLPAVSHAALLLRDRMTGGLLLLAHVPVGAPAVSLTLAQQVMDSKNACVWVRGQHEPTASLDAHGIHSGIYAPLLWQNESLGVFLVSSKSSDAYLGREDLKLIVALTHHAAMALASANLQNDLRLKGEVLERMLTNFSPRIRSALVNRASRGVLRLGGEKSEVTILCSDIRGFTKTSEKLSTDQIVELLNDYFSGLVEAIFRYDGTIDKFLGDGILAVFGSPEPDPAQHEKALRAAVAMQDAMRMKNEVRRARGLVACEIGIGVHCGEVFHGFIGTADRMEFTVIGDAVNRTARYCAGAKGGQILLSPSLFQHCWKCAVVEPTSIGTKHEGDFEAYVLKSMKAE
jgi:adenylate cyclase